MLWIFFLIFVNFLNGFIQFFLSKRTEKGDRCFWLVYVLLLDSVDFLKICFLFVCVEDRKSKSKIVEGRSSPPIKIFFTDADL